MIYTSINEGKILHELKALESSFYEDHLNKKLLPRATLDNYWPAQPEENASVLFNYNLQFMAQFQQVFKSETRAFKWSFMPLFRDFSKLRLLSLTFPLTCGRGKK